MADLYSEYLEDEGRVDEHIHGLSRQLARYFMIKLGSSSMGYPFEAAKLLRQCQSWPEVELLQREKVEDEDDVTPVVPSKIVKDDMTKDENGYLVEEPSRTSQWPVCLNKPDGIGSSALFIARRQGIFSLWNGLLPYWMHRVSFDSTKTVLEELVEANDRVVDLVDQCIPLYGRVDLRPAVIPVAIQALTGFLVSPLEVAYQRLALQSVYKSERRYSGVGSVLYGMFKEEGGIGGLFPHPILAAVSKLLSPLLQILPPLVYSQAFEPDSEKLDLFSSFFYLLGQFGALTVSPLVMLPIETIRRRLLIQRAPRPYLTRVPVRRQAYTGVWNCFASIVREEGFGALYEGFTLHVTNNALLMAANLTADFDEAIPDDIEEF